MLGLIGGRRVPLAWSNLMQSPARLFGSLAGITFAVTLMFMEYGFQNALLDGMAGLLESLDGDLVMMSRSSYSVSFRGPFSRRHLYEASRFPGVDRVSPVYIETALARWRDPITGSRRPIRVIAFRPGDHVFLDPRIVAQTDALKDPDTALFDERGKWWTYLTEKRSLLGGLLEYSGPGTGTRSELSGRPIRIVGTFRMGADFLNDGTLLVSDRTFLEKLAAPRFGTNELIQADLGLVKVSPAIARNPRDLQALADRIEKALPASVRVIPRSSLVGHERTFWLENTPVGFVFRLGMVMGFVVGTVICYQILSSEISSYLREYATLLAMGYTRGFLVRVVLQEAGYLAVLGFVAGTTIAVIIYKAVEWQTRMPFLLDAPRIGLLFTGTMAMCLFSAALAARKLWRAAPAELF